MAPEGLVHRVVELALPGIEPLRKDPTAQSWARLVTPNKIPGIHDDAIDTGIFTLIDCEHYIVDVDLAPRPHVVEEQLKKYKM